MKTAVVLLLAALTLAPVHAGAQETVSFKITPPPGKTRLAEVFKLKVQASFPEKYSVRPDTASFEGQDFGLLSYSGSPGKAAGGLKTETFELRLQAFTLGVSTFPELTWTLYGAAAAASAKSPSFTMEILPAFETRQNEDIRDIYPPFRYFPWLWLLAGALAAAAGWLLYRRFRRASAILAAAAWTDARAPYRRAKDRLGGVEKSGLAAAGKMKEYYSGLAAVLRFYLVEEFSINADLMTTSALARELKRTGTDIKATLKAREFLQKADLVKFARLKPEDAQADAAALDGLLTDFNSAAETARAAAQAARLAAERKP
ncbi:MAG: hypothetical protein A2081_02495 [Elusimicrobia bacterium GWC2_61_19]|nr:MAG: hypothetical protein A2081_02495 [Elusimicrobia bacterium GWC2_61_19]